MLVYALTPAPPGPRKRGHCACFSSHRRQTPAPRPGPARNRTHPLIPRSDMPHRQRRPSRPPLPSGPASPLSPAISPLSSHMLRPRRRLAQVVRESCPPPAGPRYCQAACAPPCGRSPAARSVPPNLEVQLADLGQERLDSSASFWTWSFMRRQLVLSRRPEDGAADEVHDQQHRENAPRRPPRQSPSFSPPDTTDSCCLYQLVSVVVQSHAVALVLLQPFMLLRTGLDSTARRRNSPPGSASYSVPPATNRKGDQLAPGDQVR